MKDLNEEKLLDLLCKKAAIGLDSDELKELKELEKAFPEWADQEDSFELAAAAINLSAIDIKEEMPAHLRSKILASADEFFESEEMQETISFAPRDQINNDSVSTADGLSFAPKTPFWQWFGWGVAAFACVALAVNLYLTRFQNQNDIAASKPPVTQTPTPQLTDAQKREQLLALAKDTVKIDVAKADPKAPNEIQGDVVWSNTEQKGYIRLRGLPVNDPSKETYQIWIFDGERDDKYPIDGGIFNVNQNGEVIIPMDAKLQVKSPKIIAITKEKPGGVVVSDRTGIVAIAKV